jgi:hypothetical protein
LIISHLKWLEYPMILLLLIFFDEICMSEIPSLLGCGGCTRWLGCHDTMLGQPLTTTPH